RGAQVHECRVRATEGVGQQTEGAAERDVLVADRLRRRVRVRDQAGKVVAALLESADRLRRVVDEALERLAVVDQLARHARAGGDRRVEVLEGLGRLGGLPLVLGRAAL